MKTVSAALHRMNRFIADISDQLYYFSESITPAFLRTHPPVKSSRLYKIVFGRPKTKEIQMVQLLPPEPEYYGNYE